MAGGRSPRGCTTAAGWIELGPTADGGAAAVSRRLPDGVPGFLRGILPSDGRVTQTDTWGPGRGRRAARHLVRGFAGSPGEVSGENVLEPGARPRPAGR